jgi:hypothetical protein
MLKKIEKLNYKKINEIKLQSVDHDYIDRDSIVHLLHNVNWDRHHENLNLNYFKR